MRRTSPEFERRLLHDRALDSHHQVLELGPDELFREGDDQPGFEQFLEHHGQEHGRFTHERSAQFLALGIVEMRRERTIEMLGIGPCLKRAANEPFALCCLHEPVEHRQRNLPDLDRFLGLGQLPIEQIADALQLAGNELCLLVGIGLVPFGVLRHPELDLLDHLLLG